MRLVLLTLAFATTCCHASIIGTTVNGGFFFHGDVADNQFDPNNAGSGTTAVIGATSPTFETIVNGEDFNLSAAFDASQLHISFAPYRAGGTFNGFQLVFEDSAFNGLALSLLSFGGPFMSTSAFSYSLAGDTITFNVIDNLPVTGPDEPYTTSFSLATSSAPEPASLALAGLGTLLILLPIRKRLGNLQSRASRIIGPII